MIFAEEVKFHDPSEFAQQNNVPNPNIQRQQEVNQQNLNQNQQGGHGNIDQQHQKPDGTVHAPHAHQAHGHGIGESVDAE